MTARELIIVIHAGLGFIGMYISWVYLIKSEKLRVKELREMYPNFGWMRLGLTVLHFGWIILVIMLLLRNPIAYFVGVFCASIGLFYGALAWKTGVCVVPGVSRVLFVVGDNARRAGRLQTIWSLVVIGIAVVDSVVRWMIYVLKVL